MEPKFTVYAHVACSPSDAFEAVADPDRLSRYFTTGGAVGRLESGATVQWDFADFPGAFPVEVVEVIEGKRIALRWDSPAGGRTEVVFDFDPVDGGARTKVSVTESGWPETDEGLAASYGNCMGWSQMLCAMKCWIERGFNLREGMYK
jgi:uncharacterized protein YndB with AHSA1/START domain